MYRPQLSTRRTVETVAQEIADERRRRDEHTDNGELRLAAECSFAVEELTREYAALQRPTAQLGAEARAL